jgi:ribosomal protein S3
MLMLRLKNLELSYDIIKYRDNTKYHLGISPQLFITTFNRRFKKGWPIHKILRDLKRLLNIYIYRKRIKGYYIRIKGRFARGRRKKIIKVRQGFISFNSLNIKLNSCYGLLYTKFGISGIKIIISN